MTQPMTEDHQTLLEKLQNDIEALFHSHDTGPPRAWFETQSGERVVYVVYVNGALVIEGERAPSETSPEACATALLNKIKSDYPNASEQKLWWRRPLELQVSPVGKMFRFNMRIGVSDKDAVVAIGWQDVPTMSAK